MLIMIDITNIIGEFKDIGNDLINGDDYIRQYIFFLCIWASVGMILVGNSINNTEKFKWIDWFNMSMLGPFIFIGIFTMWLTRQAVDAVERVCNSFI